jgi:ribose/xylose/arabinose/galactoside ABC-type transport system permease subunit
MLNTGAGGWRRLLAHQEIGLALVMAMLFVFTAARSRTAVEIVRDPATNTITDTVERNLYLKPSNLHQILRDSSYFAIMAVGATLVLVCGGVDLSIGAIFALSAVVAAKFMSAYTYTGQVPISAAQELEWIANGTLPSAGGRIALGVLAGLATGALCGCINGLLITGLKSPPFLITLGTMMVYRGIAFILTDGQTVSSLPAEFVQGFGQQTLPFGFNIHVPVTILVGIAGVLFLSYSVPGRMALAVGGNEEAARTAGLPVNRIKILVYTLAGMLGGLTGLLYIGFLGSIQSGDGNGYELTVIAAVVIGGASLSGGRGTALGAILGALFLQQITNAFIILRIDQNWELIVKGMVIVTAAALNRLRERALGSA